MTTPSLSNQERQRGHTVYPNRKGPSAGHTCAYTGANGGSVETGGKSMKHPRLVALAAALSATVAIPALAQNFGYNNPQLPTWDRIGSVDFTARPEQEVEYNQFGGRMTRLSFRAANSDVQCRDISATFNN